MTTKNKTMLGQKPNPNIYGVTLFANITLDFQKKSISYLLGDAH
jgi:hypothetical protein